MALACTLPAFAQTSRFSFGATGGVRLSSGAPDGAHEESPRDTVGADFEVAFGDHLAAEAGALYKRFGFSYAIDIGFPGEEAYILTRGRANSLEFPIVGKYYFGARSRRGRFFVATGYSFQRSWASSTLGVEGDVGESAGGAVVASPGPPIEVGAVFGAGWARKMGRITMAPTFRYTHWGSRYDGASVNQLEVLLSLRL